MKLCTYILLQCLALGTATAAGFVYETEHEFSLSADFDGDARLDVGIVDRLTGNYRIAYQLAPSAFTWANTRASGIENVTAVTAGRLLATTRDALAITGPDANRITFLSVENPNVAPQPLAFFATTIGPSLALAIDIGGPNNTAHDDIFAASVLNGVTPFRAELMRNTGSSFLSPLLSQSLPGAPARANQVVLRTATTPLAGFLLRGPGNDTFKAFGLSTGAAIDVLSSSPALPAGSDYAFGNFNLASQLAQFLFYKPGLSGLSVAQVQEPTPGTFSLLAGPTFNLGTAVRQVIALTAPARLLVIFGTGETARVYDFDGSNAPVPREGFSAPPGETFTGAALLGGNNFMLLSGNGGLSSRFHQYSFNGTTYQLQASGTLPGFTPLSHRANVLALEFEAFAEPVPRLLQSLHAGDWASSFILSAGPQVTVTAETFGGSAAGLGNPTPVNLGFVHSSTHHVLVNQYSNAIAVFSLNPPIGREIAQVAIVPPAGHYHTSVQISFQTNGQNAEVYFRRAATENWTLFIQPFWLFKDTTVSFYARPIGDISLSKTTIRHAVFTFAQTPDKLDSDGDGVPDYVEIAKGLDPVASGNDGDGDGIFDLDELTSGNSPALATRPDPKAAVDLVLTPRPFDGTLSVVTYSSTGTVLRAYDLQGSLLAFDTTQPNPMLGPTALLSNVIVDTSMRLLVSATDPHYDLLTPGADKRIGRELLRLFDVTSFVQPVTFPSVWSGGDLQAEATQWILSASNQLFAAQREKIFGEMAINHVLAALLFEQKIQQLLLSRGFNAYRNLTLFPFRPADAGLANPSASLLLSLESLGSGNAPAFKLPGVFTAIETALSFPPGADPYAQLKNLTAEIYRISSASNNVPPGVTTGWPVFPSPINTLRHFLRTGELESNYLARSTMSSAQLQIAFNNAQAILASIGPRPVATLLLKVRPDSFAGTCTLLDKLDMTATWALYHNNGDPLRLLEAFELRPGSVVSVTGFTDISSACGGNGIEVIAMNLVSVPPNTALDTDGDLLLDSLELLLFGSLSQNGSGDFDGDGFSNLQEILDGTDPLNGASKGGTIVQLTPPAVELKLNPLGQLKLQWEWPAAYSDELQFNAFGTPALGVPFVQVPASPVYLGNNTFEATLPAPAGNTYFYQLNLKLK
jgi:hypothetical protein